MWKNEELKVNVFLMREVHFHYKKEIKTKPFSIFSLTFLKGKKLSQNWIWIVPKQGKINFSRKNLRSRTSFFPSHLEKWNNHNCSQNLFRNLFPFLALKQKNVSQITFWPSKTQEKWNFVLETFFLTVNWNNTINKILLLASFLCFYRKTLYEPRDILKKALDVLAEETNEKLPEGQLRVQIKDTLGQLEEFMKTLGCEDLWFVINKIFIQFQSINAIFWLDYPQITLRIVGYHFSSWLRATLNLWVIYFKLLVHML